MERYAHEEPVSNDDRLREILEWPTADFTDLPDIYALGRSLEESERVQKFLEGLLTNQS